MFVLPCAIVAFLSLYLSFLCFGLLVWTQSRPYGLCHCPYALAHIKGFGSPHLHVYACLLLCFMLVLASLVLGFATLDALSEYVVVWLRPTPLKPFLVVTTWDALPWCRLLRANLSLFTPCNALFIMPICATRWLSMHLYTLAYMSMHESYLLLCCPYFNTMKLWTSDPNLHLSLADTTFCLLPLLLMPRRLCPSSIRSCSMCVHAKVKTRSSRQAMEGKDAQSTIKRHKADKHDRHDKHRN